MTVRPSPELVNCPHCDAKNPAIVDDCASCGKPLTVVIGPRPKVRHFNLRTGMILIAVIAVCLGIARQAPGLGVVLLVVVVPALIRTVLALAERKADGRPARGGELASFLFFTSLGIVLLIEGAALAAFVATCAPIGCLSFDLGPNSSNWPPGMIVAFLSGFAAAGFVIYLLGKKFWPRKD